VSDGIWTPIPEGPHEEFVGRLIRTIAAFAETHGVATPVVEVELADSARFVLEKIDPEPGSGMVTLHVRAEDDDGVDALIVPIGSIRRFELRSSPEERVAGFGFTVPRG
jgi:hypothetical protein